MELKEWLLNIGKGKFLSEYEKENEAIEIPEEFLINQDIITKIFGDKLNVIDEKIHEIVILAAKNVDIHSTNNEILLKIKGDVKKYISIDSSTNDNDNNFKETLPVEFLNSLTPNSLPSHKLQLNTCPAGSVLIL